jgi:hypothetical protein
MLPGAADNADNADNTDNADNADNADNTDNADNANNTDSGAMTSLNLASNYICLTGNMDGIKAISSAIKVLAIILVPFSSLSDLSLQLLVFAIIPRI